MISLAFLFFLTVSPVIILAAGGGPTYAHRSAQQLSAMSRVAYLTDASQVRVAVVKPVFTATAYASFYAFYSKYAKIANDTNVKADLGLLNKTVVDSWGWSEGLLHFLSSGTANQYGLVIGKNLTILNDIGVTEGALFNSDGSSRFDVVILGFAEYVTSQEYMAFKHFVADGGALILMDATNFLAEVKYYPGSNHLALVKGHGWGFDGIRAWRDAFSRWSTQNTNWVGSNYCCSGGGKRYDGALLTGNDSISLALEASFGPRVSTSYAGHEENRVTNMTGTAILARWVQSTPNSHNVVAAYLHKYGEGTVIHMGVMGSDVISSDRFFQSFLVHSISYASGGEGNESIIDQK